MKVIVMQGGDSPEREVSIKTGNAVQKALKNLNYEVLEIDPKNFEFYYEMVKKIKEIDPYIVFIALHGSFGENGKIQALLEMEKIPYTGSGTKSSAICMDKEISLDLAESINIPVAKFSVYKEISEKIIDKIITEIKFPLVVKPNDGGSSFGITILKNEDKNELITAFKKAKKYSEKVIFQRFIAGNELTVSILDEEILPIVEIKPKNGWYDFENKYTHGNTKYICPAKLSKEKSEEVQNFAKKIYSYLDCFSYARVDFRNENGIFYLLEVNTLPGMTSLSLTPMAAEKAGLSFEELIEKIIISSKERKYV